MGYLAATLTHVFTRARGANLLLEDVTIAQMGNGATECGWNHAPEARGGFWEIWKSQWVELSPDSGEDGCSRRPWAGVTRDKGADRWKSQNRRNVYLSPYVEEPLNSKVIKSFVPGLRSRKCFSCFEIPMFYVYIYIYIYIYIRTLWTFCAQV